ncbi:MAG: type II toxin-antitoxin system HicB family antitoxin [Defluviitaleaceae bacterium]|nr:type II toxin-antitoxin system HicB family antitoxin [Defluviitaleaceae bacterium]
MKYTYPAIFRPSGDQYHIFFPDIEDGATCGDNINECIEMATDWLSGALYMREKANETIPQPTKIAELPHNEDDIITLILADTAEYKNFYENTKIKKSITIPMWLDIAAKKANINFSQTLQGALKTELGIQ